MQATIEIKCYQCLKWLGSLDIDTANMPDELQEKINRIILSHRQDCFYYKNRKEYRNV